MAEEARAQFRAFLTAWPTPNLDSVLDYFEAHATPVAAAVADAPCKTCGASGSDPERSFHGTDSEQREALARAWHDGGGETENWLADDEAWRARGRQGARPQPPRNPYRDEDEDTP